MYEYKYEYVYEYIYEYANEYLEYIKGVSTKQR